MSVVVTGAAGFIGSHLVEEFLSCGAIVIGLDNFDDFYSRNIKEENLRAARDHKSFRLVEGDIRSPDLLEGLPDDIDCIIHLAAKAGVRPSIEQPTHYAEVNLIGTANLLDFAKRRGIGRFLFASSSSVYGNTDRVPFSEEARVDRPISPYAAQKKAGELLCHTASHLDGLTTLCLRFFTVYGPRQRPDLAIHKFAKILMQGRELPMFGDGTSSRDYTYISDIIDGVMKAYDWSRYNQGCYEIVNLGESRTITLSEMIHVLSEELGVTPRIRQLPPQPGDVDRTFADIGKARDLFGYDPVVDFREGIQMFVSWLKGGGIDREV